MNEISLCTNLQKHIPKQVNRLKSPHFNDNYSRFMLKTRLIIIYSQSEFLFISHFAVVSFRNTFFSPEVTFCCLVLRC